MKIETLETIIIELPGRSSYGWRSLEVPIGRYVILKVTTDTGITGLGEAPAILSWGGEHGRYFGEDPHIVCYLIDEVFKPLLIGADPKSPRPLLTRMDEVARGFPYTKAMIESALLDIVARDANMPVYQLLGGAIRKEIPICHSLGLAEPADAATEAEEVVADGLKWIQIKVGGDPVKDLEVVCAIRQMVGDDINLYPDVNRGYQSAKIAIATVRAMQDEANICAIEQPVEGIDAMATVVAGVDVPVIVDEGCWSPQDTIEVVNSKSADIVSIYYTKASGLLRSMEIAAIATAAGLPINVNGSLEAGVGNAANLHLAAALDGTVMPAVITINTLKGREQTQVGGVFYTDDIITEPFAYADGCLSLPDGPGLGVELDLDKIEKYRAA